MKVAFIFPGQGSQYIGMSKDFYEQKPESREVFESASEIVGYNMAKLCFEENAKLNKTEYTQPAILTACVSILKSMEKEGVKAEITAGLSLGEYCCLVANGVLTFEDALKVVQKRGIYMENEVPAGTGSMSAVVGLSDKIIEEICETVSNEVHEIVEPANYNYSGQVVISGEKSAVLEAGRRLINAGAKRVLPLNVSGPFHSSMLKGAGGKLADVLKDVKLHNMKFPYIPNVTAEIITDNTNEIKKLLERQVFSPVKWRQSITRFIEYGVDTFIEIGPGRTLSGFIKKSDKTVKTLNIEKIEDLLKII